MAERYVKQIEFTNSVYLPDCPVALEKGAVLLDTKTNTYILQMKLGNIGMVRVTSARVYIEALDSEGKSAYPGVYNDYGEIADVGEAFGSKKLLPLPNNNAVTFRVYVESVTTADGAMLSFTREEYTEDEDRRDIADERERAFRTLKEEEAKRERLRVSMWGAVWYHVVLGLCALVCFFLCLTSGRPPYYHVQSISGLFFSLIPACLWIFPWLAFGTPELLKRLAMVSFGFPVIALLLEIMTSLAYWRYLGFFKSLASLFGFLLMAWIIAMVPFVCVFLNARKHDKTLKFTRSLLFWMPPEKADVLENKAFRYAAQIGEKIIEHTPDSMTVCPHCSEKIKQGTKFCPHCGGKLDGQ